jgi:flavin-dependent dehydrogenase
MVAAMRRPGRCVAILGGGPAGATLSTLLARAGLDVVLFARGGRPPIVVGESLVPACVPFLRQLGVEDEVASYSIWKGGATFVLSRETRLNFRFAEVRGARTTYSYNVPRDRFDASLLEAARRAGVRVIPEAGRLERIGESDQVRLSDETLEKAGGSLAGPPDFIVDAGGRSRTIPRLLGIPVLDGKRRDSALHAHFEGIEVEIPGNVHTDRLDHGWLWRIPLPGRVSMGLVIDSEFIRKFGNTSEEQLDGYLRHDPVIRDYAKPARRITPVVRYTNYQSRAQRGVGRNWALVGDTFGFVDPVFSSGLLIAFQSATLLAKSLIDCSARALSFYEKETLRNLEAWQRVIGWFYDGRLLTLLKVGQFVRSTLLGKLVDFHFRKHMPRIFTGEDATNRYSLGLIEFMVNHGLVRNDPSELRVN